MIIDTIQEWFKEVLIDGIISNLSGTFDTVNTKVAEIAGEVGMTPSGWNGGIFNMIRSLSETVIVPIAGIILTFVMCYELIQLIVEKNNLHDFDTWLFWKWIFKTFCAVLIVTNTWNIVMAVFDVAQSVVDQSAGVIISDAGIDISGVVGDLETTLADWSIGSLLGLWFQSVFVGLCSHILTIAIFLVIYGRMIEVYQNRDNESDIIELPYEESFAKYTLRSEKTIEEAPFFVSRSTPVAINMIYPYSMLESVVPEAALNQFRNTEYFLTSSNHAASFENLATVLTENGLSSRQLFDYAANAETNRNVITIIRVFAYGFIVLISLIAAANVFNTISTNISLRRREFAMLKSVGMTQKGFRRMMNCECLLYGSKALLLGLPVSCGITYLIYRAITTAYETSFHLPWAAIGIAVLSVFLVVFATMMYSMSKVKKDNPIDALKNENL